jgi:hypothetical protein
MAYGATPTAPRSRPGTVNTAVMLLYAYGALTLVGAVLWLANLGAFKDAYTTAYKNSDVADQAGTIATVTVAIGAAIPLLFGIAIVIFAIPTSKGRNWARIVTWVLGGIGICCGGSSLISSAVGASFNMGGSSGTNMPSQQEVQRAVDAALPSWFTPSLAVVGILGLLALIGAVILLALPASNEFFRKQPEPTWEPPAPPSVA